MNEQEQTIKDEALKFAKKNKKRIAIKLTNPNIFAPSKVPISVFMAGSPGAGKTEFSKNLINILEKNKERRVIRIDGDDIREQIPGYNGRNSFLFQSAISYIVEKIHDFVLKQKQNFVLDGTFSKYSKAFDNIRRSLDANRFIVVFYVYQKPVTAWKFTEAREAVEGRNIPKASFLEQFTGAREVVTRLRVEFTDDEVTIFLVKKDFEQNTEEVVEIRQNGKGIDDHLPNKYTREELETTL